MSTTAIATNRRQYCTFVLDGLYFGINVERVQEVLPAQKMTRVPLATDVIRGLINLRGQIVVAMDLRRRFELAERLPDELPMCIVIHAAEGVVSLLVDQIGDVLELDFDTLERTPETVQGVGRELIQGAYQLEDRLLLVLDLDKAIEVSCSDGSRAE